MKMPKVHDSLSWGKRGNKKLSAEDSALVSAALSNLNKFSNDGNFMAQFESKEEKCGDNSKISKSEARTEPESAEFESGMSANQLAAKALQLRMKGKHEEAEKLMVITYTLCIRLNMIFSLGMLLNFASQHAFVDTSKSNFGCEM